MVFCHLCLISPLSEKNTPIHEEQTKKGKPQILTAIPCKTKKLKKTQRRSRKHRKAVQASNACKGFFGFSFSFRFIPFRPWILSNEISPSLLTL
jgi:hypothetical protein